MMIWSGSLFADFGKMFDMVGGSGDGSSLTASQRDVRRCAGRSAVETQIWSRGKSRAWKSGGISRTFLAQSWTRRTRQAAGQRIFFAMDRGSREVVRG